jgi:hypothetical protein
MRRPAIHPLRDLTDTHLRRAVRALGYRGQHLPLAIADMLVHPLLPGQSVLLHYENQESRREAADRLRRLVQEVSQ